MTSQTVGEAQRVGPPANAAQAARPPRAAFDPAAAASAIALALTSFNASAHPWSPAASFMDAIINEWIITFTALCAAFIGAEALFARVASLLTSNRRPPAPADDR